ncbi:protein kinase domain-containing protein [Streptomyces longispororuber]|uniref:serine/threonine-protein kinase n=1 Tax=Streptomyces longispororuber TaxID=68230 RepID=UPI00210E9779|nr:serine/threonine-protein kinase [Streptomyces longispororuber]MCQ4213971.1 serine/threonine-protein kinase [Streptomyces longispororuber]
MLGQLRGTSPRSVGPYVTLARLGAGGMGEVFLARPARLTAGYGPDDLVAVKVIRNEAARDEGYLRRFEREAAVAAAVSSPYVARLVGSAVSGEQPWLATEFVTGPTLAQAVRRHGPLPPGAVAALGAGLARGLAALHAAGALHRDVKPGNVLLAADGPRVIDLGVARVRTATTLTETGLLVGTPGFMSPEHVAGGRHVVPASDVFCLASVLAYAATGRDPFGDGPVAAVLYRVSQAEAELGPMPEELATVLRSCLARDPAERPSAADVADTFDRLRDAAHAPEWPDAVREAIEAEHREVRQLCAAGGALEPVAAAPAWPRAQDGSLPEPTALDSPATAPPDAPAVHRLPTMSSRPPQRRRRRGPLVTLAAALALGVLGGLLAVWQPWAGDTSDAKAGPRTADPRLAARAGVDEQGTGDRSGTVEQLAGQRPAGWHPWQGKLRHAPYACAADTHAIVCLLTNGTYDAISAVDGHQLWKSGQLDVNEDVDEAYVGPTGGMFIPGEAMEPQVRGGRTLISVDTALQMRDSATGKVLWRGPAGSGATGMGTRPLLTDEAVLTYQAGNSLTDRMPEIRAYAPRTGRLLWHRQFAREAQGKVETNMFTMQAVRDGVVYADSPEGLAAYDTRTGRPLGTASVPDGCHQVLAGEDTVVCSRREDGSAALHAVLLTPRTLRTAHGTLTYEKVPHGFPFATVTAVTGRAAVAYDPADRKVAVADRATGRVVRVERLKKTSIPASRPLVLGDRIVYADAEALYTMPLDGSGGPRRHPVTGAPGDRPEDSAGTSIIAEQLRPPVVLSMGGVVHLVYDEGAVVSVALPSV